MPKPSPTTWFGNSQFVQSRNIANQKETQNLNPKNSPSQRKESKQKSHLTCLTNISTIENSKANVKKTIPINFRLILRIKRLLGIYDSSQDTPSISPFMQILNPKFSISINGPQQRKQRINDMPHTQIEISRMDLCLKRSKGVTNYFLLQLRETLQLFTDQISCMVSISLSPLLILPILFKDYRAFSEEQRERRKTGVYYMKISIARNKRTMGMMQQNQNISLQSFITQKYRTSAIPPMQKKHCIIIENLCLNLSETVYDMKQKQMLMPESPPNPIRKSPTPLKQIFWLPATMTMPIISVTLVMMMANLRPRLSTIQEMLRYPKRPPKQIRELTESIKNCFQQWQSFPSQFGIDIMPYDYSKN